jgi:hypothetical protein
MLRSECANRLTWLILQYEKAALDPQVGYWWPAMEMFFRENVGAEWGGECHSELRLRFGSDWLPLDNGMFPKCLAGVWNVVVSKQDQ